MWGVCVLGGGGVREGAVWMCAGVGGGEWCTDVGLVVAVNVLYVNYNYMIIILLCDSVYRTARFHK